MLRPQPLGIRPGNIGPEHARVRGYKLSQFKEAFARYLPPEGEFRVHSAQPPEKSRSDKDLRLCTPELPGEGENQSAQRKADNNERLNERLGAVRPEKGGPAERMHVRTETGRDEIRWTSSDPLYTGPVVEVPDQGLDPLDEHGTPRATKAPPAPLTPGHARELHAWSLDWTADQQAKGLNVSTADLEAELRIILREELPPDEIEAAIKQVMDLVFAT
jgi:hypothetical protein